MGLVAAVGLALGFTEIVSGINAGEDITNEADYNASIKHKQAGMITDEQRLLAAQDDRAIRFAMGKTVATTAGKGLEMSGSPMAILIDTATQMEMDKAIGQYNLEVQKRYTVMEAETIKRTGRLSAKRAVTEGITSGLKTMFMAAMPQGTGKVPKKSLFKPQYLPRAARLP